MNADIMRLPIFIVEEAHEVSSSHVLRSRSALLTILVHLSVRTSSTAPLRISVGRTTWKGPRELRKALDFRRGTPAKKKRYF